MAAVRAGVLVAMFAVGCGRLSFDPFGDDSPSPEFETLVSDDHLVGYWKLDETTFADSSRFHNGANGCLVSCPPLAQGVRGKAADFHDSEGISIGTVAPLSTLATTLTLAAWVKLRTLTQYGAVISNDRDCSNCGTLNGFSLWSSLYNSSPWLVLWNQSSTAMGVNSGTGNIATGTWVFLAGTYDGQTERLYIDGTQVNSYDHPNAIGLPHSYPLRIGHQGFDAAGGVDGLVDEVMVFDRALTPDEIQTLYAELKP